MRKFALLSTLFLMLITVRGTAQTGFSANITSKGNIHSLVGAPEGAYSNMLFYDDAKGGVYLSYQNNNLIPGLDEKSIAFYFSKHKFKVNVGLHLTSLSSFVDQLYFIHFGYHINNKVGIGLGFGYRDKEIRGYAKQSLFQSNVSFRYNLSKKNTIGATALFFQEEEKTLFHQYGIGLKTKWSKYLYSFVAYEGRSHLSQRFKGALEVVLTDALKTSGGISFNQLEYFLGASVRLKKISIYVSVHFHEVLPISPGASAAYTW